MKLTPRQEQAREIINGPAMHALLDGGSRSGKTALFVRNIAIRAIKAPRSRHAILRFRFNQCKESIGLDTLPKIMQSCFPAVPYTLNKSDWYATLPNKSELWLGGLDDKERTEKILGKEFATIYLNECSQISWASRNMALTRLAQKCPYTIEGETRELALKMYYDCNPPSKGHWAYQVFYLQRDPETKNALPNAHTYAHFTINPMDNAEHLPADYLRELQGMSTRMRKRFFEGLYADMAPGALWTDELIDKWRVSETPDLQRIVVAVDPSGSDDDDNAGNDDIGIIVAGIGTDGIAYVLEDLTLKAGPKTWGGAACHAYDRHDADVIVGEVNFGGAMVGYVIDTQPKVNGRARTFKCITASRGKAVRAEPISALHEQGKVRFAGTFPELEDEMCAMTTHGFTGQNSPNRVDALVWAISELFPGMVKEKPKEQVIERAPYHHAAQGWMAVFAVFAIGGLLANYLV